MEAPALPEFEEKAPYEKGFSEHFKKHIQPILGGLETQRIEQYKKFKRRLPFGIILAAIALIGGISLNIAIEEENGFFIQLGLAGSAAVMAWAYIPVFKYKEEVKSKFLPAICSFYGNISYKLNGTSDIENQLRRKILPDYSTATWEDFIEGEHQGVKFHMHETTLSTKNDKGQSHRVFSGLILKFEFPKAFHGRTILLKDGGTFGNFLTGKDFNGLAHIALEDPEFEKLFQVFGSDQIEARVLLTTAFMERILKLATLRSKNGGQVQAIFQEKELVLAIRSDQNLFEPGSIRESALNMADLHLFLDQMNEVFELIKVLKLDRV
jgi:hypothetical protein